MTQSEDAKNLTMEIDQSVLQFVLDKLKCVDYKYSKEYQAIGLAFETEATTSMERRIINQIIIQKYGESDKSLDILAVAIAYSRQAAFYRKLAIKYFEKYWSVPANNPLYSEWHLHLVTANLYENEYMFDQALNETKLCIKCTKGTNLSDYISYGDILIKIDVKRAKIYYDTLMKSSVYNECKYAVDIAYKKLLEKIENNYVYKPRKTKSLSISLEEKTAIEVAKQFI